MLGQVRTRLLTWSARCAPPTWAHTEALLRAESAPGAAPWACWGKFSMS